ncbi:MAG: LTA synthase family protein [Lachnospiraceae bacterium]|nr:LTA synthase family protein [Lachnospiraceae bacterium]
MKARSLFKCIISILIFIPISCLAIAGIPLLAWYNEVFVGGSRMLTLVYTIKNAHGASPDVIREIIYSCRAGIVIWIIIVMLYITVRIIYCISSPDAGENISKRYRISKFMSRIIPVGIIVTLTMLLVIADRRLEIIHFFTSKLVESHFIEDNYVVPDTDRIIAKSPKNLIHIYIESMEPAFASEDVGGCQPDINYIPNLTKYALEGISFSDSDQLGGFKQVSGTGWTASATFAVDLGVPYLAPTTDISAAYEAFDGFGDILEDNGYYLEYICGSDADFSGRKLFLTKHGDYEIMDYYAAIDKGYIPADYYEWWGYEDKIMYEIAKTEITEAASVKDRPFAITMLTADTHYTDGYVCDLCEDTYDCQYANVVKCADNQIADFLTWCSAQDWYEDTVIIIQGDHPYMKKNPLTEAARGRDRTTYNCFLNVDCERSSLNMHNREFLTMDLYPTILYAIGFEIPGDRLGLGTNLFSDKPTLAEQYGIEYMNAEFNKHSQWYFDNIVWDL